MKFFPGLFKLKFLSNGCKELKVLKITNAYLREFTSENEVKKIFPNCYVELKKCGNLFLNGEAFDGYFWSHPKVHQGPFDMTSLDGDIELMFSQNNGVYSHT